MRVINGIDMDSKDPEILEQIAFVQESREELSRKICPLRVAPCTHRCVCYIDGRIGGVEAYPAYCGNKMFFGEV